MTTCKNCDAPLSGKYCSSCSQPADTHRFTLWHFAHEFFHALTHTDKGILFLIKEMFYKPGVVASEYMGGKRKKYFSPFTFLLIAMAVEIFASTKTNFYSHFSESLERFVNEAETNPQASAPALEDAKTKVTKMSENSRLITFLFLPLLAILTWLFFRRSGYNYAENLIFNILIQAQSMIFFLLICILPFLFNHDIVGWLLFAYIAVSWIYYIIAYRQFYKQSWGKVIFKGLAIQIAYIFVIQLGTKVIFTII